MPEPDAATWERFKAETGRLPERFWLAVATIEPRKNLGLLLDALQLLRDRDEDVAQLVHVGGRGWGSLGLENRLAGLTALGAVQCVGHVEPWWLQCALRRAEALVMPSRAEGFGLPVLEAMAAACPVICSDIPVFHEVTGGHARFFDPRDPEGLAAEMSAAAADRSGQSVRARRAREFVAPLTWERAARRTLEVYREALGDGG
jgi:glycosyltransferase involved in cell wall biosynthesis